MTGFGLHGFQWASALTLLVLSGPVQGQSQLQHVADDAALAAVQILSAGGGTHEAALAAQHTLAASASGATSEVTAAPSEKTVTVKVSKPSAKTSAVSTARYVPPEQPATWQWAARQRFVVKASPVVVGSACMQDCDALR